MKTALAVVAFVLMIIGGCGDATVRVESPPTIAREVVPLADQPAPKPQSPIVRFRFWHRPDRKIPETEIGQLLLERKTGRCVYHYWYDGVHGTTPRDQSRGNVPGDASDPPADRFRRTFNGAAGFDGQRFWAASYNHDVDNQYRAFQIVVFDGEGDLRKYDGLGDGGMFTPTWYSRAPLHKLIAVIESPVLERDAVRKALAASPHFDHFGAVFRQKPWSGSLKNELPPSDWCFNVTTDESELGIARVDVDRAMRNATGNRPWAPAFRNYSLISENADDISPRDLDSLTDLNTYVGESTEVMKASNAAPSRRSTECCR
jgi:hypothetical protein